MTASGSSRCGAGCGARCSGERGAASRGPSGTSRCRRWRPGGLRRSRCSGSPNDALYRRADEPVVPDRSVESKEPLHDACPQAGRDARAVTLEAELVLQRPDDGLDALAQPVRERARGRLVLAGRADQGQAEVRAGEERLGLLAGQALVGDHGGARCRAVGRLVLQHLRDGQRRIPGQRSRPQSLGTAARGVRGA